jgi:hypothetical protein
VCAGNDARDKLNSYFWIIATESWNCRVEDIRRIDVQSDCLESAFDLGGETAFRQPKESGEDSRETFSSIGAEISGERADNRTFIVLRL